MNTQKRMWRITAYWGIVYSLSNVLLLVAAAVAQDNQLQSPTEPPTTKEMPSILVSLFITIFLPMLVTGIFLIALREITLPMEESFHRGVLGMLIHLSLSIQAVGIVGLIVNVFSGGGFLTADTFSQFVNLTYGISGIVIALILLYVGWWMLRQPLFPAWLTYFTLLMGLASFIGSFFINYSPLADAINVMLNPTWSVIFSAWLYLGAIET